MDSQYLYAGYNFRIYTHNGHYTDRRTGSARHYINYIVKGRSRYITPSGTYEVGQGTLFYIPMGLPYELYSWCDDTFELRSCGFTIFPEARNKKFMFQTLPQEFVDEFLQLPLNFLPDSKTLCAFYGFLDRLVPYMEEAPHRPPLLEKLSALILADPLARIPALAQQCGLAESTLFLNVKKLTGKTPNEYKTEVLIGEALRLLASTDIPIHEISEKLGFNSTNYFRELFKKHTKQTPSHFRVRPKLDDIG